MNKNIIKFTEGWKKIFSEISKNACSSKFIQRVRKIKSLEFLKMIIKSQIENETPSLKDYAVQYETITGEIISTTALDKKINVKTIEFLKTFLIELITFASTKVTFTPELIKVFKDVYLLDSTIIELIELLKIKYPGCGGCASTASMKIQCLYNVLKIKYEYFEITNGITTDQSFGSSIINKLSSGSLILFDLGYTTTKFLTNLTVASIYYICRFPDYWFKIFDPLNKQEIDLLSLLKANKNKVLDILALVGPNRIPCRIIAFPLKKAINEIRKEKAIKKSIKKGYKSSQRHLEFLGWSIYLTNAPFEMVKTKDIFIIYRLRWRIELIFKLWKSRLALDHLSGKRVERIEFELYAKLIVLTLYNLFIVPVINVLSQEFEKDLEISEIVSIKVFKNIIPQIIENIGNPKKFLKQIVRFTSLVKHFGLKSKSNKKKSTFDLLKKHVKGGYDIMRINNIDFKLMQIQFREININKKIYTTGCHP